MHGLRAFHLLSILLIVVAILTAPSSSLCQSTAQDGNSDTPADKVRVLARGEIIKRSIKGGEAHTFLVPLTPSQYIHIVVEQQGVNVIVRLYDPNKGLLVESDSPNGKRSPEAVSVVAQLTGDYIIEVSADNTQPAGHYELRVDGPLESTSSDESRVTAERIVMEAERLMSQGTAESRTLAIEQYKKALVLWGEIGDSRQEGYTLCNIGRAYRLLGKLQESIDYLNQAISRLQVVPDISGQSYALNEMGAAQRDLGDPSLSFGYYNRALELRHSIGDEWGEAQLLNNIGYVYSKIGRQQKAIEYLESALPLWRAVADRGMEMNTLNNIAKAQLDMGNLFYAFERFNEVLKYCRETGDNRLEPFVINSLGLIYDTWAESQEAFKQYDTALNLFRAVKNREGEAIVLDNIGMVYAGLGDAQESLRYFQDALRIRQQLNTPSGEAVTLSNIGYAQTLSGNYQEALKSLNLALPLARLSINKPFEAYSLVRVGMVYIALNDPGKALESYRQALDIQRNKESEDRRGQAITLDKMGQAYALTGQLSQALDGYKQALQQWAAVGDRQGQALSLYGIAKVELDRNNLSEARDRIDEAIGLIESLRYKMSSHQLRMTYFAGKQDFYTLAIDIRMRLYELNHSEADLEAALFESERSRARELLDILTEAHADLNRGMSVQDAEKNHRLEQEISSLTQSWLRLRSLKRMEDAAAVEEKLNARINEQEKLQTALKISNPSFARLNRPRPLRLREIQRLLDSETVLLEYALLDGRSYLWAVTRDKISSYRLAGRTEIKKTASEFRQALTAYEPPKPGENGQQYLARLKKASVQYRQLGLELSRLVLGPVASQIGQKRLIIVADGALQYIPFEALPAPNMAEPRGSATEYQPLILQHEIVYQPSASTLGLLRETPRPKPAKTVAVFADPVFDNNDERVRAISSGQRNMPVTRTPSYELSRALRDVGDVATEGSSLTLQRLRYTEKEANAITETAPSGTWMKALGFNASRSTVASASLSRFSIVHFATHGILNDKHPELSGIVLSMVDEQGQPENGYLRLADIYNLNLPVNLVVLSACRTGIGKQVRGEGLLSLTRGFIYAGASKVVASLWKVDDEATSELMKRFYWYMLKEDKPAASALRLAQIDIMRSREQWSPPYYWAGFVLHGDWK
jgi:CHAT domain-containing protein/predicted negative regulator of RcsB-dependent stress response